MEVRVMLRWTGRCAHTLAFGGSLGCGDAGLPQLDGSGDTGSQVVVNDVLPLATQVGSEGFWGCPVEALRTVAPTEPIDALGGSPVDLVAARVGTWSLSIVAGGAEPASGLLTLADAESYRLADVTEGPGCVDHLVAAVTATLSRDATTRMFTGLVAVRPDAGRLLLADTGDLGEVAAIWGPPTLAGVVGFRIEGDLDPVVLDGTAAYVDCAEPMASCPSSEVVAEVDGAR